MAKAQFYQRVNLRGWGGNVRLAMRLSAACLARRFAFNLLVASSEPMMHALAHTRAASAQSMPPALQ